MEEGDDAVEDGVRLASAVKDALAETKAKNDKTITEMQESIRKLTHVIEMNMKNTDITIIVLMGSIFDLG